MQPAHVEECRRRAARGSAAARAGAQHGEVPDEQLQQQRHVAHDLDVDGGEPRDQPVRRQARDADDEAEHGGEHDAEGGHQQRIEQADQERAAVGRSWRRSRSAYCEMSKPAVRSRKPKPEAMFCRLRFAAVLVIRIQNSATSSDDQRRSGRSPGAPRVDRGTRACGAVRAGRVARSDGHAVHLPPCCAQCDAPAARDVERPARRPR